MQIGAVRVCRASGRPQAGAAVHREGAEKSWQRRKPFLFSLLFLYLFCKIKKAAFFLVTGVVLCTAVSKHSPSCHPFGMLTSLWVPDAPSPPRLG